MTKTPRCDGDGYGPPPLAPHSNRRIVASSSSPSMRTLSSSSPELPLQARSDADLRGDFTPGALRPDSSFCRGRISGRRPIPCAVGACEVPDAVSACRGRMLGLFSSSSPGVWLPGFAYASLHRRWGAGANSLGGDVASGGLLVDVCMFDRGSGDPVLVRSSSGHGGRVLGPDHGIGLRPLVGTPRVSRTGKETGTARPMGGMRSETGLASQRSPATEPR